MISVRFERDGDWRCVAASGHAGYHPGNDIVCAAASCLMQVLAATLRDEGAAGLETARGDGMMRVAARCGERTDAAFGFAERGMRMLEKAYPECVRVE